MRALFMLGILVFSSQFVCADVIEVRLPKDECLALEVDLNYTAQVLKADIQEFLGVPQEFQLLFSNESILHDEVQLLSLPSKVIWVEIADQPFEINDLIPKKTHVGYRNYNSSLTKDEKSDIYYILSSLAKKSLVQLLKIKSKMKSAGDRIDQIHPLTFLSHIFRDEELKAYVHAVKKRGGFLWDEFYAGFRDSLKEEIEIGNVPDSMIHHFSDHVGIDVGIILGPIHNHEWEHFIKLLITHIPREDDSGRYDM